MDHSKQLSNHIKQVYFGGNWTEVNFKETVSSIRLETAKKKVNGFNTILALTFHIHYFIKGVSNVFKGGPLEIRDKYSYNFPDINTNLEWENYQNTLWNEAEEFVLLLSKFPNEKWNDAFTDEKYGSYYTNILGLIEHTHYHLGQIVILKKLIDGA